MYASLCFMMHIPQTSMTNLLASLLHWLLDGGSRWPSTLHELSAFHQVICEAYSKQQTSDLRRLSAQAKRTPPAPARPGSL